MPLCAVSRGDSYIQPLYDSMICDCQTPIHLTANTTLTHKVVKMIPKVTIPGPLLPSCQRIIIKLSNHGPTDINNIFFGSAIQESKGNSQPEKLHGALKLSPCLCQSPCNKSPSSLAIDHNLSIDLEPQEGTYPGRLTHYVGNLLIIM